MKDQEGLDLKKEKKLISDYRKSPRVLKHTNLVEKIRLYNEKGLDLKKEKKLISDYRKSKGHDPDKWTYIDSLEYIIFNPLRIIVRILGVIFILAFFLAVLFGMAWCSNQIDWGDSYRYEGWE